MQVIKSDAIELAEAHKEAHKKEIADATAGNEAELVGAAKRLARDIAQGVRSPTTACKVKAIDTRVDDYDAFIRRLELAVEIEGGVTVTEGEFNDYLNVDKKRGTGALDTTIHLG